ncbi:MAG TPA: hypothetical protein VNN07_02215, partial [Candidatus Tectomicrobia bacterium]|nr:hypothetical protein [Candidatus Tectomicrobia bacterium]
MARLSLALALVAALHSLSHAAADPPARGSLPTVKHGGHGYVELARVAERLKARVESEGPVARLRSGSHVVTLARDWARILVDANVVVLDAPVRVRDGAWLVPESFLDTIGPRLGTQTASVLSLPPRSASAVPPAPAVATPRVLPESPR